MVWGAISRKGHLQLVFIDQGVKTNAEYYKTEVLQRFLLPQAPSHISNIVQMWCEDNLTDFIPKNEWPHSSPDLNPLDFSIWGYMLRQLGNYEYHKARIQESYLTDLGHYIGLLIRAFTS
jgi:hypothetical protein